MRKLIIAVLAIACLSSCEMIRNIGDPAPVSGKNDVIYTLFPLLNKRHNYTGRETTACNSNEFVCVQEKLEGTYVLSYSLTSFLYEGKMYDSFLMNDKDPNSTAENRESELLPGKQKEIGLAISLSFSAGDRFAIQRKSWRPRDVESQSLDSLINIGDFGPDTVLAGNYYVFSPLYSRLAKFNSEATNDCSNARFVLLEIKKSRYKSLVRKNQRLNYVVLGFSGQNGFKELELLSILKTNYKKKNRRFEFEEYMDVKEIYGSYPVFDPIELYRSMSLQDEK